MNKFRRVNGQPRSTQVCVMMSRLRVHGEVAESHVKNPSIYVLNGIRPSATYNEIVGVTDSRGIELEHC